MFERLPTPFGLVRYGVAPDQPKIKSVIKVFERIAADPRFNYFGNVTIGRDLSIRECRRFYDAVIMASGNETPRRLEIAGEDLPGSHAAHEFTNWYNGHPDFADHGFDLTHRTAVVIGNGNVAIDVARILGRRTDDLRRTDIAGYAFEALAESEVREILVVGRRGPVQASFSQKEIKELGQLQDCGVDIAPVELELDPTSQTELRDACNSERQRVRKTLQLMAGRRPAATSRRIVLRFLRSPVEILGAGRVTAIELGRNRLAGDAGGRIASGTGESETIDCGLVIRCVGYRGVPVPGLPYNDESGTIPNASGRVVENGTFVPGIYVAGWIKHGPRGLIGNTKVDSAATIGTLLGDLDTLKLCGTPDSRTVYQLLDERNIQVVDFTGWKQIDAVEIRRGERQGKPREKLTTVDEMLTCCRKSGVRVKK